VKPRLHRVYCDTSVFGGVYDAEFSEASVKFLNMVREGIFDLVISPLVRREIMDPLTPRIVVKEFNDMLHYGTLIEVTREALSLQMAYIDECILSQKWENDALHVALASVSQCDMIVSWNFKHIVNFRKISLYNAVNILMGFPQIQIYSPLEVIENEE
jgi:predicted nucleic acid-binding protein